MEQRSEDNTHHKDITYINIYLEYLSTATDKYDNDISYFKIIDSLVKATVTLIKDIACYAFRMPYWITDDNEIILNVKHKFIADTKFKQGHVHHTNNELIAYVCATHDGDFMQGMCCTMPKYNKFEINVDIKHNDNT